MDTEHSTDDSGLVLRRLLSLGVGEAFGLQGAPAIPDTQDTDILAARLRARRLPVDTAQHVTNAIAGIKTAAGLLGWRINFAPNGNSTLVIREPSRSRDLASSRRKFTGPVSVGEVHRPTSFLAARDELMQSRLLDAERVRTMKPGDSFRVEAVPKRSIERRAWIRQAALFTGRVLEIERLTPRRHESEPATEIVVFEVRCVGTQSVDPPAQGTMQ